MAQWRCGCGLAQWVRDPMLLWAVVWVADAAWVLSGCGCGVATVAVAPIGSLAWEPPCAVGVAPCSSLLSVSCFGLGFL